MSVALTYAGESLIARLQAEGRPLTIDTFVFADVPGVDHTAPVNPGQGLPEGHEVYRFAIPAEYRAFVNPNQVVYSALLGSDIGPFVFNWQGLYCTEHATLVAVATFPRLEKRKYDPATNTQGNNLTRNFMLEFSGAREVTQVTVEAAVWQLDFSVRLKGMDERERLSNRDIYGRAAFLDDGWLLTRTADAYRFEAGRGYVEGIRAALAEPLPAVPTVSPCDVWLDVSMQAEGSDVVTTVSPLFLAPGTASLDYTAAPPHNTRHHCEKVARIEADGTVVDLRPKSRDVLQQTLGVASIDHAERRDNPHGVTLQQLGFDPANVLPRGIVSLWAGAVDAVPEGWALCDGENGTPDLRDRFVIGAGGRYSPGGRGGVETVTPTGTVQPTTLTTAQMPSHTHGVEHWTQEGGGNSSLLYFESGSSWRGFATGATGGSGSHAHPLALSPHTNLPPYYALAYIMKL